MPTGRAVLLLRRLSTGDNRLKSINLNQNTTKEPHIANPVCSHRDLNLSKRISTFGQNNQLPVVSPQLTRSFSDNIIKMTTPTTEANPIELPKHTNALVTEKSPYLLQHAHNPVQWYPWSQEAFDRAKNENKLIFLSVGYSTCHWCHVMEKESFENEEVAKIMNEHYINIKVDREERPDIDRVYMLFITATTGRGGWPMSVFLTPDLLPVTGGTYFPPEDNYGRPGFKTILLSLAKKWKENTEQFKLAGVTIIEALQNLSKIDGELSPSVPGEATWNKCVQAYIANYEPHFGGFGLAPKFPNCSIFNFLFHFYARDKSNREGKQCLEMCLHTLTKIAKGGIHDHISSGFARYSVDNDWHVPHFEKMLYDQAQLACAYTDAYLATKDEFYADVVRDIMKYVNRDLRHVTGGFYSAEDADSYPVHGATQKKEGAFCVWDYEEIESLLGGKHINDIPYLDIFCHYFSVEEDGNISPDSDPHGELTRKNMFIVYGSKEETAEKFGLSMEQFNQVIAECTEILYEARLERPRPHLDSKMLCSWNGLMISGLAQAGQGLGEKEYVEDAIKTANFIKKYLYDPESKKLLHSCYRADDGGVAQTEKPIEGFLDDYAFLVKGLLDLYEASLDLSWLNWARELQNKQDELFWDEANGGYFSTAENDETVVLRLKEGEGFLDDYAFLVKGLMDLYEALLDLSRLNWARELQREQDEVFWDKANCGYFSTPKNDETVVLRLKEDRDGAEPSGNSVSCHNLQRLAAYGDKSAAPKGGDREHDMAKRTLISFSHKLTKAPTALPEMMSALMFYNDSPTQVLIAGGCSDPRTLELVRVVRARLLPGRVLAVADPAADSAAGMSDILLTRIRSVGDTPTAYVCRRYACSLPVTDVKQLESLLDEPQTATI